jgi:hypothetical protein
MRPADNIEESIKKLRYKTSAETHDKVLGNVLQALDEKEKQKPGVIKPDLWRMIMKNTFTKIAAAIVVIAGILIGLYFAGNPFVATVTFADVIQPILNARTASLDIIIGSQGNQPVIHDDIMGSRIRRTVSNIQGPDIIIDLEQQRLLTIDHDKKTATYIGLGGLPDLKNYVEVLRNSITRLQSKPDFQVENRGVEEFEGQDYLVFVASGENDTVTVWADPETALPVRIEHKTPNMLIACDNLQFNVTFDESLFSMEAPDDYVVQDAGAIDFSDSSESAFIESLRIWAEIIEDGQFPDSINLEDVVKIGPKFDQGLKRAGLTEEQQAELAMKWGQGLVFIRFFKGQGQWHYAGQGVKLGDSATPIFWYQSQGSETYRVIYGDLHVEDVAEEDLPKPLSAEEEAQRNLAYLQWSEPGFLGTQEDLWYVTGSNDIEITSEITLSKVPEDTTIMPIALPYKSGKLQKVTMGGVPIVFRQVEDGRYELEMPPAKLSQSDTKIQCMWTLSVNALEKVDYGYRTVLKSLIPVVSYKLTVSLGPESNYLYTKTPGQQSFTPFSWSYKSPKMDFGSCGLLMQKRN